jgi:antitoxin (DNA-binding transcriptional repressor) of toxin-antitoxin stability system
LTWQEFYFDYFVPRMSINEQCDPERLRAWLKAGETVELREGDELIGRIVPEERNVRPADWPDFAALRKEIVGERVLPGADLVIDERGRY